MWHKTTWLRSPPSSWTMSRTLGPWRYQPGRWTMSGRRVRAWARAAPLRLFSSAAVKSPETPISAPVHDSLDKLITHNRRVNYRVEPPPSLAAHCRINDATAPIVDISRTHLTVNLPSDPPAAGTWLTGVAHLAGTEIPISGRVHRVQGKKVTVASTVRPQPPMIADDLRRQADHLLELTELAERVGRPPSERPQRPVRTQEQDDYDYEDL